MHAQAHAHVNAHAHESLYTFNIRRYIKTNLELTNNFDGDSLFLIAAVPTLLAIDSLFEIGFSFSVLKR